MADKYIVSCIADPLTELAESPFTMEASMDAPSVLAGVRVTDAALFEEIELVIWDSYETSKSDDPDWRPSDLRQIVIAGLPPGIWTLGTFKTMLTAAPMFPSDASELIFRMAEAARLNPLVDYTEKFEEYLVKAIEERLKNMMPARSIPSFDNPGVLKRVNAKTTGELRAKAYIDPSLVGQD